MIPLIKPDISFSEVTDDIKKIIDSGFLTSGPYVEKFEHDFASYIGTKYALSTTSATTALHLSLVSLGVDEGDEILVSDFTFPASGNAIVQTGAKPVFVDCKNGQFDLDWNDALKKVNKRTKGIMIVHPFGQPINYNEILNFKEETGLWVIEDAACAVSSNWKGRHCGTMGNTACFSFHPRKILTTGEGGMVTTNDKDLYEKLSLLSKHGGKRDASVGFKFIDNGFNYRMSEIQAAIGIAQLKRLDDIVNERRRLAELYISKINALCNIQVPLTAGITECSFQSFVVLLDDSINRMDIIKKLKLNNIESTLGTYAMHMESAFKKYIRQKNNLPNSLRAKNQSLTLPLYRGLKEEEIDFIVSLLCP